MKKIETNIMISGSMRSGTTLMGSTIDAHPQISLVSDILNWFWSKFYPHYGEITTEYELNKAIFELEFFITYGLSEKQKKIFYSKKLKELIVKRGISSLTFYYTLIELFYYDDLKPHLGIKATHQAKFYKNFIDNTPNAKIIHMTRNVLDIYNSHKRRTNKSNNIIDTLKQSVREFKVRVGKSLVRELYFNEGLRRFTPYVYKYPLKMFDEWALQTKIAIDLQKENPQDIIIVKYEDFVTKTELTLRKVLEFLSIDWVDDFYLYENLKDRDGNKFDANTSSLKKKANTFSSESIGKGVQSLSEEEKKYYNTSAKEIAEKLNY